MSKREPVIAVVGSINMDLVVRARHIPAPGETVLGEDFTTIPGGKGANQAVAAARLGASVMMIGRLGDDDFGDRLLQGLKANNVDCRHVLRTASIASGVAMIVVAANGENAITVASGANFHVTPADIDAAESAIRAADVCVLQLELPIDTVVHTIQRCREWNIPTILDPAPAPAGEVPSALYGVDILTPNESEARSLTGLAVDAAPKQIAEALAKRGANRVVLKRGHEGAYAYEEGIGDLIPGFQVETVDTTAAGDAFTAALAVARAEGQSLSEAVRFANAAGGLACTKHGAQPSMPTRDQVARTVAG